MGFRLRKSINFGGTVHISGSVGDKSVRVSKNNIGTRSYISGKIGNAGIRASVNKIGTKNYTIGSVGGRPVSVISNTFGGKASYNFYLLLYNSSLNLDSVDMKAGRWAFITAKSKR